MPSKSKKHSSHVGEDAAQMETANPTSSGTSGKRKKEKRRSGSKREPMKSLKESIRNRFSRKKVNGRKGKHATSNSSVASSSVVSEDLAAPAELDDLVFNRPATKPPHRKIEMNKATPPPVSEKQKISVITMKTKKEPPSMPATKSTSPKVSRKVTKTKEKRRDLPLQHIKKATQKKPAKEERNEKSRERRPKTLKADPEKAYRKYQKKAEVARKKKKKKASKQPEPRDFRSFSDSSDYSESDDDRRYHSDDGSSVYSDPGFDHISYSQSDSVSGSDSEFHSDSFHSSDSSGSYSTNQSERTAWKRNPEEDSIKDRTSRKSRREDSMPVSGHISSPRSSARRDDSHQVHRSPRRISSPRSPRPRNSTNHVRSPRRSNHTSNRYFRDDEDDYSDGSSYGSGSSYFSSETDSSHSSDSSFSDGETNGDYYTTSYDDDTRNLRDSTFSTSWTEGPLTTYGSEDTERTRPNEYPTLLKDVNTKSMDESQERLDTQSMAVVDSREIESMDESESENENDEFEREQEAAQNIERERAEAKNVILGQQDLDQHDNGVLSWILRRPTLHAEEKNLEPSSSGASTVGEDEEAIHHISSPQRKSQRIGLIHSPRSPQSLGSTLSAASSENYSIARDRRSALFSDDDMVGKPIEIDPIMSSGSNTKLDPLIVGGDSIPGSYEGPKEGEFLLPKNDNSESPEKNQAGEEELSVTMRGSGTFKDDDDDDDDHDDDDDDDDEDESKDEDDSVALDEIAFDSKAPGVASPLSKSGREESQMVADEEDNSFLFCCFSPQNSIKEGMLPSSGAVEQEFSRMIEAKNQNSAFNFNDDGISALLDDNVDDTTCASTINTSEPKDARSASAQEHYFMLPTNNSIEDKQQEINEEKNKIDLGPCSSGEFSVSHDGVNRDAVDKDEAEPRKRIKAEILDDYDISEIVHGKRSFKSKTDEEGVPIPVSDPYAPTGRRERRKIALKAHRDFLYKTRSIDSNASLSKEGTSNAHGERQTNNGDASSAGPSVLSNSIVQEHLSIPNDGKPEALIDLVRNAFSSMMLSGNDGAIPETSPVDREKTEAETSAISEKQGDGNIPLPSGPMDDVLEAAFRFFAPIEEKSPLITVPKKADDGLRCTQFNPNPNVRKVTIEEESNSVIAEFDDSSSAVESIDSNLAVQKDSGPKIKSPGITAVHDGNRFNADGIPLQLRPKKIWRAFDSGFSVSQSVVTTGLTVQTGEMENSSSSSTEPKSNRHRDFDSTETKPKEVATNIRDPTKLRIHTADTSATHGGPSGVRLSTSPRYRRRAEMMKIRALRQQRQERSSFAYQAGGRNRSELPTNEEENGYLKEMEGQSYKTTSRPLTNSAVDVQKKNEPNVGDKADNGEANISIIRDRIKQRRRSKFNKEQLQQQHALEQTVLKCKRKPQYRKSLVTDPVMITNTTDRRDDSFSEYYDAITYDNEHDKEKPRRQFVSGAYQVPVTDERECVLNGVMSLD